MDPQCLVLSTLLLFLSTTMAPAASSTAISPYIACLEAATKSCFPFLNFTFPFAPSTLKGCGHPLFQVECMPGSSAVLTIGYSQFKVLSLMNPGAPTALRLGFVNPIVQLCALKGNMTLFDLFASPFYPSNRKKVTKASAPPAINVTEGKTSLSWLPCPLCDLIAQFVSGDVVTDLISNGFKVECNQTDDWFRKCKECMAKEKGICGFNASAYAKPFLCYPHVAALLDPSGRKMDSSAASVPSSGKLLRLSTRIAIFCASVVFLHRRL